jgi:hypothetical protein
VHDIACFISRWYRIGWSGVSPLAWCYFCGLVDKSRATSESALTFTPVDPETRNFFLWEYLEAVHGLLDARCAPILTSAQHGSLKRRVQHCAVHRLCNFAPDTSAPADICSQFHFGRAHVQIHTCASTLSYKLSVVVFDCNLTHSLTHSTQHSPSWKANRFAASQEIPRFYGTRRFITAFTSTRHLSLSWASLIQSILPSHYLKIQINIMLPSKPGSPQWSLSLMFLPSSRYPDRPGR